MHYTLQSYSVAEDEASMNNAVCYIQVPPS